MRFDADTAIRILTMLSLGGLLFTTGLRLTWKEIVESLRGSRLIWILPINFIVVPALTYLAAQALQLPPNTAMGMMILGAAPFAPVVPIFAKMSRSNLALAGTLTALFPFFAAFLTPLVCEIGLKPWLGATSLKFDFLAILGALVATITLPLAIGVGFSHWFSKPATQLIKPCEIISETAGAISLAFVTFVEFPIICGVGGLPLLVMAVLFELSLWLGFYSSGPDRGVRQVVALGAANRNIALALLVALESFPGSPVIAAVVANGLLLIFLGLLHVAWWRIRNLATYVG